MFIVRSGEMLGGGGGKARYIEFDSQTLWVERVYISAVFGLWEELSKMKVFKYQPITCIKRLRRFSEIKKTLCTYNVWGSMDLKFFRTIAYQALCL